MNTAHPVDPETLALATAVKWLARGVGAIAVLGSLAGGAWPVAVLLGSVWVALEVAAVVRSPTAVLRPDQIESLIESRDFGAALKRLDAVRNDALRHRDVERLEEVIRLGFRIERAGGRTESAARSLLFAARQNVRWIKRQRGELEPVSIPREERIAVASTDRVPGVLAALRQRVDRLAANVRGLEPATPDLTVRLERLEGELETARMEVASARALVAAEEQRRRAEAAALRERPPVPAPKPVRREVVKPRPVPPAEPRPSLVERMEAMGPRLFAWAGGAVMLLGVVFLFAFATRRGWIGPELRLVMGGVASAAALCAGLWIRRRYGALYSALAAVGVGLAGLYTTILAAAALYEFLPPLGALLCALVVAGAGTAVSLAWRAEIVAGLALVGAMLLPVASLLQGERSLLGLGFVAVLMAASSVVALVTRWLALLCVAAGVSAVQLLFLVTESGPQEPGHVTLLALTAVFWAIYVATGVAHQILGKRPRLDELTPTFVLTPGLLLALAASHLLGQSEAEGVFLLGLAGAYAVLGAALVRWKGQRDLATLAAGTASVIAVFGLADLLSGDALAAAWAAEAVVLAFLGRRAEARFRIAAVGCLVLAGGHVLAIEAPPRVLFEAVSHPGAGAWSIAIVAVASAALAYLLPAKSAAGTGVLDETVAKLTPPTRIVARWAAGVLSLYALSLAVLEVAPSLETGHVALSALWSAIGLALTLVGLRGRRLQLEWAGLALIGVAVVEALTFDWQQLSDGQSAASFWILAAAALLAGHAEQLARPAELSPQALVATIVSVGLATGAATRLLSGDGQGLALLCLAAIYGLAAGASFLRRLRDLATLDGAICLTLATAGFAVLMSGIGLIAVGAAAAALLAWLSAKIAEERLLVGSVAILGLTLGYSLVQEAPPSELFQASAETAWGAAAIALCAASCSLLALHTPARERMVALWAAGVLSLYALSLAILAAADALGQGSEQDAFQRGHTAVSGTWALVALAFLYLGLTRRARVFQLLGFAVFGVVLAKIFFFDLPNLSSVTRALSFMAVGALLLTAGYFYQRLADRPERVPRGFRPSS